MSWVPPAAGLDESGWLELGRKLGANARANQWWIGDWLQYGNQKWGEKYSRAARVTGLDPKTLRNIASVAARVEVSRRRDKLTFSLHAEVAALSPEEQVRWLDLAEANRMSVLDLRTEINAAKRKDAERGGKNGETQEGGDHEVICPHCEYKFDVHL